MNAMARFRWCHISSSRSCARSRTWKLILEVRFGGVHNSCDTESVFPSETRPCCTKNDRLESDQMMPVGKAFVALVYGGVVVLVLVFACQWCIDDIFH